MEVKSEKIADKALKDRRKYKLKNTTCICLTVILVAIIISFAFYQNNRMIENSKVQQKTIEALKKSNEDLIDLQRDMTVETEEEVIDGGSGGNAVKGNNNNIAGGDVNG